MDFSFISARKSHVVVFSVLRDARIDGDLFIPNAGLACVIIGKPHFLDGAAKGTGLNAVNEIRLVLDLSIEQRIPGYLVSFIKQFSDSYIV